MSTISPQRLLEFLDKWGVRYVEHSRYDRCAARKVDWHEHFARRGRDCAYRPWDAYGIAAHHSGGPTSWQFVWDGRTSDGIPGPLYFALIYPDGVAHLVGWETTNNVGRSDKTVRDRVLRGDMPTSGGNVSPGADDYSAANSEFYGIAYRGTEPNKAQRRTALLMCAAICDAHPSDWDGGSVAGHKELTRRKPDPAGENMSSFRAELNALLAAGPGGSSSGGSMDTDTQIKSYVAKDGDDSVEHAIATARRDAYRLRTTLLYSGKTNESGGTSKYVQNAGWRRVDNPAYPGTEEDPRPTGGDDPDRKGASWRYAVQRIWRWTYWTFRRVVRIETKTDEVRKEVTALRSMVEILVDRDPGVPLTREQVRDVVDKALQESDERIVRIDVSVLEANDPGDDPDSDEDPDDEDGNDVNA